MAKILNAPSVNSKKRRISLRLPKEMLIDVDGVITSKGGNKKQRSQYISDSIIDLEHIESYPTLITENWLDRGENTVIQITLSHEAEKALERVISATEQTIEVSNELISPCIRTAIIHWLLRNNG